MRQVYTTVERRNCFANMSWTHIPFIYYLHVLRPHVRLHVLMSRGVGFLLAGVFAFVVNANAEQGQVCVCVCVVAGPRGPRDRIIGQHVR